MRQLKMAAVFLKSVLDTLGSAVHPSGQWRYPHIRTFYIVPSYHKTDNNLKFRFNNVYTVSLYLSLFLML